jgi:hypothetical protein
MATIGIPVGKLFPEAEFKVVYKNGVVSAIPKGEHSYIFQGKLIKRTGDFPHVTMVPFDLAADGYARANAGKPDFQLQCERYHVTDSGQARIWRIFEYGVQGQVSTLQVKKDNHNADSNLGVDLLLDLNNRFLNALGRAIGAEAL